MKIVSRTVSLAIVLGWGMFVSTTEASGPKPKSIIEINTATTASQTIEGKLIKIEGNFYIIEDLDGKQARLQITITTLHLNGQKKPGDTIRVEVNRAGQILSIQ